MTSSADNPVRDYLPGALLTAAMLFFGYVVSAFIEPVALSFVAGLNRQLSGPARLVIGLDSVGRHFWWLILLAVVGFFAVFERKYIGESKAIARRDVVAVLNLILFVYVALLAGAVSVELARAIS